MGRTTALVCTVCASQLSFLDVSFVALRLRIIVGIVKVLFFLDSEFPVKSTGDLANYEMFLEKNTRLRIVSI